MWSSKGREPPGRLGCVFSLFPPQQVSSQAFLMTVLALYSWSPNFIIPSAPKELKKCSAWHLHKSYLSGHRVRSNSIRDKVSRLTPNTTDRGSHHLQSRGSAAWVKRMAEPGYENRSSYTFGCEAETGSPISKNHSSIFLKNKCKCTPLGQRAWLFTPQAKFSVTHSASASTGFHCCALNSEQP